MHFIILFKKIKSQLCHIVVYLDGLKESNCFYEIFEMLRAFKLETISFVAIMASMDKPSAMD